MKIFYLELQKWGEDYTYSTRAGVTPVTHLAEARSPVKSRLTRPRRTKPFPGNPPRHMQLVIPSLRSPTKVQAIDLAIEAHKATTTTLLTCQRRPAANVDLVSFLLEHSSFPLRRRRRSGGAVLDGGEGWSDSFERRNP